MSIPIAILYLVRLRLIQTIHNSLRKCNGPLRFPRNRKYPIRVAVTVVCCSLQLVRMDFYIDLFHRYMNYDINFVQYKPFKCSVLQWIRTYHRYMSSGIRYLLANERDAYIFNTLKWLSKGHAIKRLLRSFEILSKIFFAKKSYPIIRHLIDLYSDPTGTFT